MLLALLEVLEICLRRDSRNSANFWWDCWVARASSSVADGVFGGAINGEGDDTGDEGAAQPNPEEPGPTEQWVSF